MRAIIETQPSVFASIWRYKFRILAVALIAGATVYGISLLQPVRYSAEGTVLLNDPRSASGLASEIGLVVDSGRYVANQAQVMESPQVAVRATEILGDGTTPAEVREATTADPAVDVDAVTVRAIAPTAEGAVSMVDAVVQAYEEIVTEQIQTAVDSSLSTLDAKRAEIAARIEEYDGLIAQNPDDSVLEAQRSGAISQLVSLDTRIEQLSTNAALYGSGVQLYVAPDVPPSPIQPNPLRNAVIAAVFGFVAACAWAWWRAGERRDADHQNAPAMVLGAPLLASIPEFRTVDVTGPIPTVTAPESQATEAYHFALSALGFALDQVNGHSVLITSTSQSDGKTVTALNLAIAAAHDGREPLLVDADERVQGLTKLSGLEHESGISDLNGSMTAMRSIHPWTLVDGTELSFIPAGTGVIGNTAGFFRSEGFKSAMAGLVQGRDITIIDSPPVMAAAETADVAASVQAVVLVVAEGTRLADLDVAKRRLAMSGTPLIGYIFNRSTHKSGSYGYGYGYGSSGSVADTP